MALSRIFQDEINASEATKAASTTDQYKKELAQGFQGITTDGTPTRYTYEAPRATAPVTVAPTPAPNAYDANGVGIYSGVPNTTVTPVAPPAPEAPADGGGGDPTSYFDLDEIRAALDAITAQYELERGDLGNRKQALGRALELLLGRLGTEQHRSLFDNKARNSGSGRIRSGLFLKDQARIADTFADQIARARGEADSQLSPIQRALSTLNARRDAEKAMKAREIAREQLATQAEIARALELV